MVNAAGLRLWPRVAGPDIRQWAAPLGRRYATRFHSVDGLRGLKSTPTIVRRYAADSARPRIPLGGGKRQAPDAVCRGATNDGSHGLQSMDAGLPDPMRRVATLRPRPVKVGRRLVNTAPAQHRHRHGRPYRRGPSTEGSGRIRLSSDSGPGSTVPQGFGQFEGVFQMAYLPHNAVLEQHLDDIEAELDRRVFQQPEVVQPGSG